MPRVYGRPWRLLKLFVVVAALSVGGSLARADSDVSDIPPGVVAVVSHVPMEMGTISKAEIARAISQVSAQNGTRVPAVGDADYSDTAAEALAELLDGVDIQGEAAERGISIAQSKVSAQLHRIRKNSFRSNKEYEEYLREAKLTQRDVRLRVELQLLAKRIEVSVIHNAHGRSQSAKSQALREFASDFAARWRSRTICADGYLTLRCSNGPTSSFIAR